ncbi:hypothetical protein ACIGBL_33360 [Streptomyces sp. NPDC085614]|uniref:hypothetical protein n=1 Tax=Streptomyces sp. NPDC085614 TaxID=3365733 RepID=UPI0037D3B327
MARTWNAVLARMGVPTGDRRILDPAGGSSRELPLPLSWQRESDDGHGGSVIVGRIETLRIADGMVMATGSMIDSAPWEVYDQLEAGVIGPSVDLDDVEYVLDDAENLIVTRWRVSGATLVAIPAFADVSLTLDPLPAEPLPEGMLSEATYEEDWMYASAGAPALPPAEWFARPDLDRLTPLTVSDTGRVFGHIAGWSTCHVGMPGCVTPPSSAAGYAYFHVAEQRCADGTVTPVGTLVAGPRHADAQLAYRAAQEHYDDVDAAVARVVAGEDEHGIWVAGWLLPGAKPEAVEVFRSSPVSGDWRRVGGALELVAVCSVNTPGFPVPKARVHFSLGAQRALIGAFGITPVAGELADAQAPEATFSQTTDPETARARWAWTVARMERSA